MSVYSARTMKCSFHKRIQPFEKTKKQKQKMMEEKGFNKSDDNIM